MPLNGPLQNAYFYVDRKSKVAVNAGHTFCSFSIWENDKNNFSKKVDVY